MIDAALLQQAQFVSSTISRITRMVSAIDMNDPAVQLPIAQFRVCSILSEGPRTMTSLSRELGVTLSAMTQIADRLERTQLVERVTESDDRRVKSLQLTPHGTDIMLSRSQRRIHRVARALESLSPEAREQITRALGVLLDAGAAVAGGDR
jgi:DNA-binding MarR family transcriptional regulator